MRSRLVAIAAVLALGATGCGDDFDATCRAKRGRVDVTWNAVEGFDRYRVYRVVDGQMVAAEDTGATTFVDAPTDDRAGHDYVILPLAADGTESSEAMAACNAPAVDRDGDAGPDAVADLTCRAKSGKVDLLWTPVDGAASYHVLRSGTGGGQSQIGGVATPAFADIGLVNGVTYRYAVVAIDAAGEPSASSNEVTCMPVARGEGTPPPVVAAPACRAKNDKADVVWTPVEGAAYYRIVRATPGGTPIVAGEVVGSVLADFGLPLDVAQQYAVISVSATGAEAEASAPCEVTPRDRGEVDPNQPPAFLAEPLTSALEEHLYYDTHATRDPEDDAVTLSLVVAPGGMQIVPETGYVSWTPVASQVGTQAVEVRATDARGAFASRVFVIDVEAFDRPPRITSVPTREGRSGESYLYDVEAWDEEGEALSFGFAAPAPAGMTIDSSTGVIAWTPTQDDAGDREVSVRVSDPAGHFDSQTWQLGIAADPILLAAPNGTFTVRAGETLELSSESNYARARYFAKPLPANATFEGNHFRFTPDATQVGRYEIGFYASFAGRRAQNPVTIVVTRDNLPPVFGAIGAASVREGESLSLPVSATDPDGDAVIVSAPGLAIENAYFDEVNGELSFRPSFEQAGSYEVTFEANDGSAAVQQSVALTVEEAEPPVDALALTVDPPQSPTFVARQTLRGSVTGEVSSTQPPAAALVTGMTPTNVAQGRSEQVTLTGLRTAFAPGATQVTFGAGIAVEQVEVLSPTSLRARIVVAANADVGLRAVRVQQGGDEVPSVVAFRVEQGASEIRGRLVDSFTGQPLAGARVTLNGTQLFTETDADGNFVLEGAPPGDGVLVITSQNYEVVRADVAIVANQAVDLGDAISVDALARPSTPPGSLPRAATVASVLDRGLGSKDGGLSQEDAEALIVDTYLSLPTRDVGVIDESGAQLNPRMTGSGILSLKPALVENLARRWREGHVTDLGELIENISGTALMLLGGDPSIDDVIDVLQQEVDAAWASPSAPAAVLPILLFNEGTTLSQLPPILTAATSLNTVQEHLFMTAFLVQHFGLLNHAVDRLLTNAGLDPASFEEPVVAVSPDRGERFPSRLHELWTRTGDVLENAAQVVGERVVGTAHAQEQGGGGQGGGDPDGAWGMSYGERAWLVNQTLVATVIPALVAAIFAVIAAWLFTAVTGGAFVLVSAATLTIATTAFAGGVAVGFLTKLWAIGTGPTTRVALTPEPPSIESFVVPGVEGVQKVAIVFERSSSDLAAEQNAADRFLPYIPAVSAVVDLVGPGINPQFLEYDYHLWRYPTLEATGIREGTFVSDLSLPVPGDPTRRQFLVRADYIPTGTHYFRVVAVQYYDNFWTRSIFSGGRREIYSKEIIYGDLGVVVPNGLDPGQKDGLAVVGTLGSESVDARIAQAQELTRFSYDAATEGLTSDIVRGQGRFRDFYALLGDTQKQIADLKSDYSQRLRTNMQIHADALVVIDDWIKDSLGSGRTLADASLAVRNPFSQVSVRLQAILGNSLHAQLIPALERTVVGEMEIRTKAAALMRQQDLLSRLQQSRADLSALENLQNGDGRALIVDIGSDPLPGESTPPTRGTVNVVAVRDASGVITYSISASPGIETLDDLRRALDADVIASEQRLVQVQAEIDQIAPRLDADADLVQRAVVDVPELEELARRQAGLEAEEATIRSEMEEIEKAVVRDADQRMLLDAERAELQADRRFDVPESVQALDDIHKSKKGLKVFASAALDVFGLATDLLEAPIQVREGIRVIPSAPSAAYVVRKTADGQIQIRTPGSPAPAPGGFTLRQLADEAIAALTVGEAHAQPSTGGTGFAPNFETDWNGEYHLSFFRTAGDAVNPRAGYLVREHPFGIPDATNVDAGFPSRLIAIDSRGRVYLNNDNSNEQYGGRIFRFSGEPTGREHVGVVNYYSLDLGYGRPAEPVAMAIGDFREGDGIVEDLFVANIDRGGYFVAGIQPTNRILRVPVHYKETNPGYPANRIVGQPYAEHPDFRFTGPSDIATDRRNAIEDGIARNLYLSDEEILFVIEPGEPGGSGVVKKLVEIPGRRWSGLAVDSSGNLLFADWRAGEVFLLTAAEIDQIRTGGGPITSNDALDARAYLIKEGLVGPTDIELDNNEARYVVSTEEGFQPFNFSVIGRLGPGVTDVRLVVADHELPVTYRATRGDVFIAGFTSDGALGKVARLKVRRIDAATGRAYWDRQIIRLSLFGASVLPEPL
jgi:hypothetical protein